MRQFKTVLPALLAALLALLSVPAAGAEQTPAALTLMVYMTGSDLESSSGAATIDIMEMMRSGADMDRVNVLVCTGGSRRWQGGFPSDSVCVYRVEGRRPRQIADYGPASMGSSDTLGRFLRDAGARFPAEQYALVLWDHGGGPMNGVCFDELYKVGGSADALELDELRAALEDSPFGGELPLEWIGFDACLMASVETAHVCAPFARYMIASQETEPGSGWDYGFLRRAHEGLSGAEIGALVMDGYMASRENDDQLLTMSCVDLAGLEAVESAMRELFGELGDMIDPEHFSAISNGRRDAKSFGRAATGSEYDLVDLYSLAEQYAPQLPERAEALEAALSAAVVQTVGNQENSHGLSVYYPYYNKEYYQALWRERYALLDFVPQYCDFMRRYADVWLGERLTDWSNIRANALPPLEQSQELTLQLDAGQLENFASAQVVVVSQLPVQELDYCKVDEIDDVTLDENGVLHAKYDYRALYALDEDGAPLGDAIPYTEIDDMILIRANLTDKTLDEYWNEMFLSDMTVNSDVTMEARKGFLQCRRSEADEDVLEVVGFIRMLDDEGVNGILNEGEGLYTGKQTVSVESGDWKWVWFMRFPRRMTLDASGRPTAYPEWDNPNVGGNISVEWDEIDNEKPWKLQFLRRQYSGLDLYAQYVVRDTQGNYAASELMKIDNPNLDTAEDLDLLVAESDDYVVTLRGVSTSGAAFDDGLFLSFDLTNRDGGPREYDISAENVCLNHCLVKKQALPYQTFAGEGVAGYQLNILPKELPDSLETNIDDIRFDLIVDEARYAVALEMPVDIGAIHECTPLPERALAEAARGGLTFSLMGVKEVDDQIELDFVARNTGAETERISLRSAVRVNDCIWEDVLSAEELTLPADTWMPFPIQMSRLSPKADTIFNSDGAPRIDYPTYWGIDAINSLELLSYDDDTLRMTLESPFGLSEREGARWSDGDPLLVSDELDVRLEAAAFRENRLMLLVDLRNLTDRQMSLKLLNAWVNEVSGVPSARGACDLFSDFVEMLPPGGAVRALWQVYLPDEALAGGGLDSAKLAYRFEIDGEAEERFTTPLELRFGGASPDAFADWTRDWPGKAVVASRSELNTPDESAVLVSEEIRVPDDFRSSAVTYRAALSPEQVARFRNAKVLLMSGRTDMHYAGILQLPVTLDADGGLSCEFDGLLACMDGATKPMTQTVEPTPNGLLYDLKNVRILTDNDIMNDTIYFNALTVAFDRETGSAALDRVEPSRPLGSMENIRFPSYHAMVNEFENGVGSDFVSTQILQGEYGLEHEPVRLSLRPVSELDLYALFYVVNRDGTAYTVEAEQ